MKRFDRRKPRYTAPACTIWIIKILQKNFGADHTASQRPRRASAARELLQFLQCFSTSCKNRSGYGDMIISYHDVFTGNLLLSVGLCGADSGKQQVMNNSCNVRRGKGCGQIFSSGRAAIYCDLHCKNVASRKPLCAGTMRH